MATPGIVAKNYKKGLIMVISEQTEATPSDFEKLLSNSHNRISALAQKKT